MSDGKSMQRAGVVLLCCFAAMMQPAGANEEADGQASNLARHKALLARAAETLEAARDPAALAAAALFRWRTDTEAALELLERASQSQLSPPGLTWLQATLCGAA